MAQLISDPAMNSSAEWEALHHSRSRASHDVALSLGLDSLTDDLQPQCSHLDDRLDRGDGGCLRLPADP